MTDFKTKSQVWEDWIENTLLADIEATDTPDPVPMVDESGSELEMTEKYDSYRLGRGNGDYLYMLYLLNDPGEEPTDILPVYIGETSNTASRLRDHLRRLRDAIPISEWEDDGSWGSFGKYDHIATVYTRAESPLYAWVIDVSNIDNGPYGYPTYREELEAKMVGLAHSHPQFTRILANRDFVPNRVPNEMGRVGTDWVDLTNDAPNEEAEIMARTERRELNGETKEDLWHDWVEQTIYQEIEDPDEEDPIPLFETDSDLVVELKESGSSTVLKRSDALDARIRKEGKRCVYDEGVRDDGSNGLLYIMYQLASSDPTPADIIPRYIGKGEAYGKKNELSANFEEIAKDLSGTRSFGRWGDGSYWHVGELSDTIFGEDSKKLSWASELFEQGTHQLKDQTYLWIRAWDPEQYLGPYGYPAYLAEVEALLIGLVYETYPDQLLNHKEVPNEAPANQKQFQFQEVPE